MEAPSVKDRKYDRQLRLWASSGQQALENAHICLIGATPTGSEILKNLILPGIGQFTIVDDSSITKDDVSSNFFVTSEDIGKPRAEMVRSYLIELNPDVKGNCIQADPGSFINSLLESGIENSPYTLFIGCNVPPSNLESLSSLLYPLNIPLMIADTVGFYAYLRIVYREHTVIETHPESLVELRLDKPWKELRDYTDSFNLETLSASDLAHVPYVVLLLIHINNWKKHHNGNLPKTLDEKRAFKQQISDSKGTDDPENFDEAVASVWRLATPSGIPSYKTNELLEHPQVANLSPSSDSFWILVATLKRYLQTTESEGLLPLPGVLPDMKADTKGFIKLQNIYRQKSQQDFELFKKVLHGIMIENNIPLGVIPGEAVETFCKNAKFATALKGTQIEGSGSDYTPSDDTDDLFHIYIGIKSYKNYLENNNGAAPGVNDTNEDLEPYAENVLGTRIEQDTTKKVLKEIVRCQGAEVHNIAAFLGGIGGQECIKLITHQYIPLDNTLIFDGIFSKTASFKF